MHELTESEAKERWCPFAIACEEQSVQGSDGMYRQAYSLTGNRTWGGPNYQSKCLANGCAVWVAVDNGRGHCGLVRS